MTIKFRTVKSNDADENEAKQGAAIDAYIRSLEAAAEHPDLNGIKHQQKILKIASAVKAYLNYNEALGDKLWETHRKATAHSGNRAYTNLKIQLKSRSLTQADARSLTTHLEQNNMDVVQISIPAGKPRLNIHIGLD